MATLAPPPPPTTTQPPPVQSHRVHQITTSFHPSAAPLFSVPIKVKSATKAKANDPPPTRTRTVWLLCTSLPTTQPPPSPNEDALTSALVVREFCVGRALFCYIEKIDSTQRRSRARDLVKVYVDQLMRGHQEFDQISLHIFARAQPQYLFPHSASNPSKRALSDSELISWWAKTLLCVVPTQPKPTTTRPDTSETTHQHSTAFFAFIPGEDAMSIARRCGSDFKFGFGFGFKHLPPSPPLLPVDATDPKEKKKEKPQSATAGLFPTPSDSVSLGVPEMSAPSSSITPSQTSSPPLLGTLVPRFPDDAKQKALALLDSNATVTDLMNMLEATGECSGGRVAAFFGVYFPPPSTPPSSSTSVAVSENWEAQKKEMERFEKALAGLRFSTRQEILEASKRVLEVVKGLKGVDVVEIELMQTEESGSAVVEGIAPAAGVVVPPGIVGEEVVVSPPVVHQLGVGLVKKKKRSVVAGEGGEDNKKMKV